MPLGGLLGAWMDLVNRRSQAQINLLEGMLQNPNLTDTQRQAIAGQIQSVFDKAGFFSPYYHFKLPTQQVTTGNPNAPAGGLGANVSGLNIQAPASGGAFGSPTATASPAPGQVQPQPFTPQSPQATAQPQPMTPATPSAPAAPQGTPSAQQALATTMPGVTFEGPQTTTTQYILPQTPLGQETFRQIYGNNPKVLAALQAAGFPLDSPVDQVNATLGTGWRAAVYYAGGDVGGAPSSPAPASPPVGPSGQPGDTRTPYPWLAGTPSPTGGTAPSAAPTGAPTPSGTPPAVGTATQAPPPGPAYYPPGTFGASYPWMATSNNPNVRQLAGQRVPPQFLDANGFPDAAKIDPWLRANGIVAPQPLTPYERARLDAEQQTAQRAAQTQAYTRINTGVNRLVTTANDLLKRDYPDAAHAQAAQQRAHALFAKAQKAVHDAVQRGEITQQQGDEILATMPESFVPGVRPQPQRSTRTTGGAPRASGAAGRVPENARVAISTLQKQIDALDPTDPKLPNLLKRLQAIYDKYGIGATAGQTRSRTGGHGGGGGHTPAPVPSSHGSVTPAGARSATIPSNATFAGRDSRTGHDVYRAPNGTLYDGATGAVLHP